MVRVWNQGGTTSYRSFSFFIASFFSIKVFHLILSSFFLACLITCPSVYLSLFCPFCLSVPLPLSDCFLIFPSLFLPYFSFFSIQTLHCLTDKDTHTHTHTYTHTNTDTHTHTYTVEVLHQRV